jgi:hypothetical protein
MTNNKMDSRLRGNDGSAGSKCRKTSGLQDCVAEVQNPAGISIPAEADILKGYRYWGFQTIIFK